MTGPNKAHAPLLGSARFTPPAAICGRGAHRARRTGRMRLGVAGAVSCATLAIVSPASAAILSPQAALVGPQVAVVGALLAPLQLCMPQFVQQACGITALSALTNAIFPFPPPVTITGSSASAPVAVNVALAGSTGEGSFDSSLACPPAGSGDGSSWSYEWSGPYGTGDPASGGATTAGAAPGRLNGSWSGSFQVNDASGTAATVMGGPPIGAGYAPAGSQTVVLTPGGQGGSLLLQSTPPSGATPSCSQANLTLHADGALGDGATVTGGSAAMSVLDARGALAGSSGAGTLTMSKLQLDPGPGNAASLQLAGTFTAGSPNLSVGQPVATWASLSDYGNGVLTLAIPTGNLQGPGVGEAFDVTLSGLTVTPAAAVVGATIPVSIGSLPQGRGKLVTLKVAKVLPANQRTVAVTLTATDALGGKIGPITYTESFIAPATYVP